MKNELAMRLFSRRPLTELVAGQQVAALSDFGGGLMRPDKCSEFEPIRTPFNRTDINQPVRWLARPGGAFLYQRGRPIQVSGVMWNLARSRDARFPAGPFTNYWTGEFDGKWANQVGVVNVEEFMLEMFRVTGSDFGFLTTEVDLKAKNTVSTSYSYKGMNLESGIPGLYWVNCFSNELAGWLGLRDLPKEVAEVKSLINGGVSLKFCETPDSCRTLKSFKNRM